MLALANAIGFAHILVEIWLAAGLPLSLLVPRLLRVYCATLAVTLGSRLLYAGACPLTVWQEALKHHPDVEPLLGTSFTIEVPATWLGLELNSGATHALMLGSFAVSLGLLWSRRAAKSRTAHP